MKQYQTHILDDIIAYWGTCLFLFLIDKVFFNKRYYDLPTSLTKIFSVVLLNQVFITFPIFYFMNDTYTGDGLFEISNLYKFPLVLVFHEIMFYHAHFLLHNRFLFRHIHYLHHEWRYPLAISTIYTHPLEQLFVNVLPIVLSGLIIDLNFSTLRFWHIFSILNSLVLAHGGYSYKGSTSFHDIHHKKLNCNYGTIGLLDFIYKTFSELNK